VARTYSRRKALRLAAGVGAVAGAGWLGISCQAPEDVPGAAPTPGVISRAETPARARSGLLRLGVVPDSPLTALRLSSLEQLLVYSRLVAVDPRNATVHTDLATAFEVIEPLQVRFSLRPVAFLHPDIDGLAVPITAELVQRQSEERRADENDLFSRLFERIDAPDPATVLFTLRAPFSLFFEQLAAARSGIRGENRYPSFSAPVGSGPFALAGQDTTGNALLANPRHHDTGYPRIEQINVLQFLDEGDADGAFLASQLDVREHPNALSLERTAERADTRQVTRPARKLRGLGLSMIPSKGGRSTSYVEAFQDERVRRAISLSLDRPALAAIDDSRVASPVGAAHGADGLSYAELAEHPLYQYNPIEAAKLLFAAAPEPIEFRILSTEAAGPRDYLELIETQLRDAGFEAQLRFEDHETWETAFFAGDFEATLFELSGLDTPDVGLQLHTTGGLDGRFSLWGYSNPVFDSAVNVALSQLVPEGRATAFREAQRVLLEEAPGMLPLVTPIEVASLGPRVHNYAFDAYDFNAGWLAAEWERPA
jgi:ABC-type transport system substrate-binding protein